MKPLTVTINETANLISMGRTSVYELIDNGKLNSIKIGSRRLVTVESIERLIEQSADKRRD